MGVTNEELTPSFHGEDCLYNGEHEEFEICCDECDFYLDCFPEWMPDENFTGNLEKYWGDLFLRFSEGK